MATPIGNDDQDIKGAPFSFLKIPSRSSKPRTTGITVVSDRGMSRAQAENMLEVLSEVIDYAKYSNHVGFMAHHTLAWLQEKNAIYHKYGVKTFPGGVPFEVAVLQGQAERFFDMTREAGFTGVEISEDTIEPLGLPRRRELIRRAASTGLEVYTELGKKLADAPMELEDAVAMAEADLEAGVKKIAVEKSDISLVKAAGTPLLHQLVERIPMEHLVFEAGPSAWPDLAIWLIRTLGPDVNLENLGPDEMAPLEHMRCGLHRGVGEWFLTERAAKV